MQIISTMRANTRAEQPVMNETNNKPVNQAEAQRPIENAAGAENVSHKKEAENTSSKQNDFAKMMDEQAQKKEAQTSEKKEEKLIPVKAGKKMAENVAFLLKDNSAKLLVSGKENTDQKAAVLEAEGPKGKKKTKNAQIEQLHLAQANEEEKAEVLAESEVKNESSLVAMALNVANKEAKEADEGGKDALKNVSEVDKRDRQEAGSVMHKVSFEQKTGDEALVKEASLEVKTSESGEKADIKNIDLKDNINLTEQTRSEPIVLVTDRRSQADLAEGKPVEPTTLIRQALKESGNSEIVQRAQFILRDQAAGEIRLTLKPENLGTVRINLTLDDHRVLGRIVVDNAEVKAAFEENMGDLRERMQRGGFTMGQLDVSVGQRREYEGFQQQNARSESPFYSERHREGNRVFNQIQETPRADSYRSVLVNMQA